MRRLLDAGFEIPLGRAKDVRAQLEQVGPEGAYLEGQSLLEVRETLAAFREIKSFLETVEPPSPHLQELGRV